MLDSDKIKNKLTNFTNTYSIQENTENTNNNNNNNNNQLNGNKIDIYTNNLQKNTVNTNNKTLYTEPLPPSGCKLFCYNILLRNTYISPFTRDSEFNPRFKKIILLLTYFNLVIFFNTLIYSIDDTFTFDDSFDKAAVYGYKDIYKKLNINLITKYGFFISYSLVCVLISNFILLIIISVVRVSNKSVNNLYEDVYKYENISMIKTWKIIKIKNYRRSCICLVFLIIVFSINFYYSTTFCAVWNE